MICGTHNPHDVEMMIDKIKEARELKRPFLGICFGHQLAAIEYARNVLGIKDATSQEFYTPTMGSAPEFIVKERNEGLKVGLHDGESWWNRYEVVEGFKDIWKKVDNFMTVQYHPEYQSSQDKPHPDLVKFLNLCKRQ